ncbi:MAG: LacI family DNA-binding transcriptional regulator [Bacteroidales bacterium]|nr:LacI family DNA-binding transcriptional regulator [Bacteroidales bacterium]
MKNRPITIKDIAKELNISPSTVSRALTDHPNISAKTKLAVNKLAKKLHYKPNAVALSLRNKKTNTIGLVIPGIVHHFFSSVISGIEDYANDKHFNVMICQSNESYEKEIVGVQTLIDSRVDGLIVSMSKKTNKFEHFKSIAEYGLPLVFFDRVCEEIETDRVIVDDKKGAFEAVEYLISAGCKRIAHLCGPQGLSISQNRLKGYLQALEHHNIPQDNNLIIDCDTYEKALECTDELLSLKNPPDGIFAVNDLTAVGAMKIIKNHGLKIPEDISIIGFTNDVVASFVDPSLTSVNQKGYEMGKTAAGLLINRINNNEENYSAITKIIKTNLVIRNSTKKI